MVDFGFGISDFEFCLERDLGWSGKIEFRCSLAGVLRQNPKSELPNPKYFGRA
jgi:hypothetical protein